MLGKVTLRSVVIGASDAAIIEHFTLENNPPLSFSKTLQVLCHLTRDNCSRFASRALDVRTPLDITTGDDNGRK
jgi:hypothetical protein